MSKSSPFLKLTCLFPPVLLSLCLILLTGCATPVVKMPKTMPDIIKKYKSVSVASWRIGMNDSGVKVQKGDYFTILAEGEINIWPSKGKDYIRDPDNRLLFKVGKDSFARRYYGPELINFQEDGNIYLGYISGSGRLGWANPLITLKPNAVFELADKSVT